MPRRTTGFLATGVVLAVLGAFPAFAAETDPSSPAPLTKAQRDFFEAKIRPVLIERCHACHSARAEKPKADFLLDTRAGIRRGGASGRDAVVPGNVEGSQLIEAIRYTNEKLRMPPEEKGGRLPDAVIADFEAWVAMGAPDPRDGTSKLPREIEAETHWSFQPLSRAEPPAVRDADWPRDRLDFFVKARLEAECLAVSGDADRRTLIRRATLLL
ncbi:MAG: hypothetical protein KDM91_08920, partial [Verrucomicrobiae bacterium]|nr:hypothetical protein [Verrucomicrobiae bacterium]